MNSLGRYEILKEIGRGAMGVVYLGRDPKIERPVALKCLQDSLFEGQEEVRFQQEMLALGRLVHPGIVTIFDAGEDSESGHAYIVMEYVEGSSLAGLMREGHAFTVEQIRRIGIQICYALDFAHSRGVIHRDIKPGNILLSTDLMSVKVTDFGIARLDTGGSTQTHQLLGTPQYMSPEQCDNQPIDGRSDLFSVGAMLYELLTGEKPFSGASLAAIMNHVLTRTPPAVKSVVPAIPDRLSDVVMKALQKAPSARFSSGKEMAEALTASAGEERTVVVSSPQQPASLAPPSPVENRSEKKRTPSHFWSGVLVLLILGALWGGWSFLRMNAKTTATAQIGTVDLSSDPPGAEIRVDGQIKGFTPLRIPLSAGSHELTATKAGHHPLEATVNVPNGEKVPLELKLEKEEVTP